MRSYKWIFFWVTEQEMETSICKIHDWNHLETETFQPGMIKNMHQWTSHRCYWSPVSLTNVWLLYLDTALSHNLANDEAAVAEPGEYANAFYMVWFNTAFQLDSDQHLELIYWFTSVINFFLLHGHSFMLLLRYAQTRFYLLRALVLCSKIR